jgi:hypothetical protein
MEVPQRDSSSKDKSVAGLYEHEGRHMNGYFAAMEAKACSILSNPSV